MTVESSTFRAPLPNISILDRLDPEARISLESQLIWFSLPGGKVLFEAAEPPSGIYIVLTGCLGIIVDPQTRRRPPIFVQAGNIIGQYSLLSGHPQPHTCVAVRDTLLAWLDREAFERLLRDYPRSVLPFVLQLIELFDRVLALRPNSIVGAKTLAFIPLHSGVEIELAARKLSAAVNDSGKKAIACDREVFEEPSDQIQAIEASHELVIYVGSATDIEWTRTCVRQSDSVFLVGMASDPPICEKRLLEEIVALPWRSTQLVLLQTDGATTAPAKPWLDQYHVSFHTHVRLNSGDDFARLARYVTGRAVGLVLSGGGARGFAHLGVIKALRESGIPIDLVGGASMGAIIACGVGLEFNDSELYSSALEGFVTSNPINDYTIPLVSLIRGRKVERHLEKRFAGIQAEDLWLPFFAVASNLSSGETCVMRRGSVVRMLQASAAIPGLMPPIIEDGDVLVDGGVMNNLPCDVLDADRRGPIIGVDVTRYRMQDMSVSKSKEWLRRLFAPPNYVGPGIVSTLLRAATVGGNFLTKNERDHADLVLDPPLQAVDIRDWKSFDRAIEVGYRHAMERMEELHRIVQLAP